MKQQKRNYASGMNFNDDFDTEREGRSSKRQVRSLGVEQYYRQRRLNFCTTREASERKPTQPIDLRSQFLCCPFSLARAALNRASTIRACCGDAKWWCPWRECQVCACILTWLPTKATGSALVAQWQWRWWRRRPPCTQKSSSSRSSWRSTTCAIPVPSSMWQDFYVKLNYSERERWLQLQDVRGHVIYCCLMLLCWRDVWNRSADIAAERIRSALGVSFG